MSNEEQKLISSFQLAQQKLGHEMPWQVLQVRSNFEKRVAQCLTARSIEHYLPLYRERVKWTDRTVLTERPLFSGYLFARYRSDSRIAVLSSPGVVRSLGEEERCLVRSSELDKIRQGLASGLLLRPHANISVGARVRIRTGLFEGVEGVVTELRQPCKVVLSLAAVRQSFSLEVDLCEVEILKKPVVSIADPSRESKLHWSLSPAKL